MKAFSQIYYYLGKILCSTALIMAIHSINTMCTDSYYQPKVPKELEKFRKD